MGRPANDNPPPPRPLRYWARVAAGVAFTAALVFWLLFA